jgi:hypothetical protein
MNEQALEYADRRERPEQVRSQARLFTSLGLKTATGAFLSQALGQPKAAKGPYRGVPNAINYARLSLSRS